ncbi:GGDEF domain-containing protein [Bacillus tianshenii]|nr:GGDEF domain-containing protein [Bacillus tianshenii]
MVQTSIGEIAERIPVLHPDMLSKDVDRLFKEREHLEGSVVLDEGVPIGLVTKVKFYQKISMKYGFDVFMGRPIQLLMEENPLIVQANTPITEVSAMAMNRPQDCLYDYVIVVKDKLFAGIVSIRTLLIKFAEIQTAVARTTNPLTGLPGNASITEALQTALMKPSYAILYLDLDRFKAYNDTYGFQQGDKLIQTTAAILKKHLNENNGDFIGHIGGDDFLAVLHHHDYQSICEGILEDFTLHLPSFYEEHDHRRGFVFTKDRNGIYCEIPLVSLSIAVVTNKYNTYKTVEEISEAAAHMKKICKQESKSCYYDNHKQNPAACK